MGGFYNLTKTDPYGPFGIRDKEKLSYILSDVISINQEFTLYCSDPSTIDIDVRYDISVNYKIVGGVLQLDMTYKRDFGSFPLETVLLGVAVVTVSCLSLILSCKSIIEVRAVGIRTHKKYELIPRKVLIERYIRHGIDNISLNWKDIPFEVRMDFWSPWHIFSIVGEVLILISTMSGVLDDFGIPDDDYERVLLGVGLIIMCINLTKYLENSVSFYTLIITLKYSASKTVMYFISALPIFFGFTFCGLIMFSPYSMNFESFTATWITLFALINGDDMHGIFDEVHETYPVPYIGRIYLFIFITLFIAAILNLFIFIIEDSYHVAKLAAIKNQMQDGGGNYRQLITQFSDEWNALQKKMSIEKLFDIVEENSYHQLTSIQYDSITDSVHDSDESDYKDSYPHGMMDKEWIDLTHEEKLFHTILTKHKEIFSEEIQDAKKKFIENLRKDVIRYILTDSSE
eukprot:TRINITY_DN770_c0_g3_i1.p1 TRINITY_DN770_c0_g3~~TRINITY_DN770_c0_g3_i1.p1  ORF type:complete len:459 (+),score=87.49 TRINITY_DN770_c0_g3_i1:497-1873(+)